MFRDGFDNGTGRYGADTYKNGTVTVDDIENRWSEQDKGHRHKLVDGGNSGNVVAHGQATYLSVAPGLYLARSRMRISSNVTINATCEPCLMFGVVLNGNTEMDLQNRTFESRSGEFSAINFSEPATTTSSMRGGTRFDMAGIVAKPEWLARNEIYEIETTDRPFGDRIAGHVHGAQFAAPAKLRNAALRLMLLSDDEGVIARLEREAAAIQFVADALTSIRSRSNSEGIQSLAPREFRRIQHVRDRLEASSPDDNITLEALAREAGMSVSTLCRHFKTAFNTTAIAYLADRRMEAARNALQQQGLTITQAAHLAGYSSPANFSTAFRRRYGFSPRDALARR